METEDIIFQNLNQRRKKCLQCFSTVDSSTLGTKINKDERMKIIMEHEEHLTEMWKRLEMDTRKGDPTIMLKSKRSQEEQQAFDFLTPYFVKEFLSCLETGNVSRIS